MQQRVHALCFKKLNINYKNMRTMLKLEAAL
jgi:hypothetical protein